MYGETYSKLFGGFVKGILDSVSCPFQKISHHDNWHFILQFSGQYFGGILCCVPINREKYGLQTEKFYQFCNFLPGNWNKRQSGKQTYQPHDHIADSNSRLLTGIMQGIEKITGVTIGLEKVLQWSPGGNACYHGFFIFCLAGALKSFFSCASVAGKDDKRPTVDVAWKMIIIG